MSGKVLLPIFDISSELFSTALESMFESDTNLIYSTLTLSIYSINAPFDEDFMLYLDTFAVLPNKYIEFNAYKSPYFLSSHSECIGVLRYYDRFFYVFGEFDASLLKKTDKKEKHIYQNISQFICVPPYARWIHYIHNCQETLIPTEYDF
jgi:hypothetical protein